MKTALIIYEGVADEAIKALKNRTPLEVARCSLATGLAVTGQGGLLAPGRKAELWLPEQRLAALLDMPAGDRESMQRGPLEALGAGMDSGSDRWVYRADFVTLDGASLMDATVQRLSMQETEALVAAVQTRWDPDEVTVRAVKPGSAVVDCRADLESLSPSVSPFNAPGTDLESALPRKRKNGFVRDFIDRSCEALNGHSVNEVRVDLGDNPANALWPWGGGPALQPGTHAVPAVLATQSTMARGMGRYLGMTVVDMADPWADLTQGKRPPFKIAGLVSALHEQDRLVVYIGAPRAGGRYGTAQEKVWALETLDHRLLGPILTLLDAHRPYRIALTADVAVSTKTGSPVAEPVPVIVAGEGIEPDSVGHWDEPTCARGGLGTIKKTKDLLKLLQ